MRLAVPSTPLVTVIASSQALSLVGPNLDVVSAVDLAYESENNRLDSKHSHSLGEECLFVVSSKLRGYDADTGILGCTDTNAICVEDKLSSLGGRCTSSAIVKRRLQSTQPCNAKCTGINACQNLTQTFIDNNIGENSCCGYQACAFITGKLFSL